MMVADDRFYVLDALLLADAFVTVCVLAFRFCHGVSHEAAVAEL